MLLLCAVAVGGAWATLKGGAVVGLDTATQYYPWYAHLGERLRAGDLPGWNPHTFSGAPFAADPLSGWTYLPAMLLFSLLPVATAVAALVLSHLLLAALGAYALARALGMRPAAAMVSGVAYGSSGFLYANSVCCTPYAAVEAWLPLAFLGVELAARSALGRAALSWCGLSGVALSQIFAVWPGQGAAYALLALGLYVPYRVALDPPRGSMEFRSRIRATLVIGSAVLFFTFGLAAAGLLPRAEYVTVSNLAGGYERLGGVTRGWSVLHWGLLLLPSLTWYAGGTVLLLAYLAPLIARRRYAAPFFACLTLGALVLSLPGGTPLHLLLYLLPGVDQLHPHSPERIMLVFYLGGAMLAGATADRLCEMGRKGAALALVPATGTVLGLLLRDAGLDVPVAMLLALVLTTVSVAAGPLLPAAGRLAPTLLALAALIDLSAAGREAIRAGLATSGREGLQQVDLRSYYGPLRMGRFLAPDIGDQPFRYVGYASSAVRRAPYTIRYADPEILALEVNNRALISGAQDIQGYNPVHIARYDEYVAALNGRTQNYHDAELFEAGLASPLLGPLNVRYIAVSARAGEPDVRRLEREYLVAFEAGGVKALENRNAFPRAWIVHSMRQVRRGEALDLLVSGAVDLRKMALLEAPPPRLDAPYNADAEEARVTVYEPDKMRLRTSSSGAGLLVLSEVYYPAWRAYIDGRPVPLYVANHALRAVPLPSGEHTVELRFESRALLVGLAVTSTVSLLLLALIGSVAREWAVESSFLWLGKRTGGGVHPVQE